MKPRYPKNAASIPEAEGEQCKARFHGHVLHQVGYGRVVHA